MTEAVINVKGMSCEACARNVTNALTTMPGVADAKVSLEQAQATVQYDPAQVSEEQLKSAITDIGFEAQ